MKFASMSIRSVAVAAALMAVGFSASALTLNFSGTKSNSVLAFSADAQALFDAQGGYVEPRGNTTALDSTGFLFNMPVTAVSINGQLKISSGAAVGSALEILRENRGVTYGVTLANFTLDYINKQVLADTNARNGAIAKQASVYDFNVATPLALKYKFPLTITGHEVLNTLKLTPTAITSLMAGLNLGSTLEPLLAACDFGTLTQDISTNVRKPAANNKPYVSPTAAP